MKRILIRLALVTALASGAFAPAKSSAATNTISPTTVPKPGATATTLKPTPGPAGSHPANPASDPNFISPAEWQEVSAARQAAMKANPDLLKKAAELSDKMRAFQQKLDAAMIKENPGVAPTIAKLERNSSPPAARPSPVPAVVVPPGSH